MRQILRCSLLFGVLIASSAGASTFGVTPIRADLTTSQRMAVITLTNSDAKSVVIQVQVEKWTQVNGVERLEYTREISATPPVLEVPAGAEQVIRVALRRAPDESQELTYRVIFQEMLQEAPKNFIGLQVALRLSVPVFVAPSAGKPMSKLHWDVQAGAAGEIILGVLNEGTAHTQVSDLALDLPAGAPPLVSNIAKYVLAGSRMSWTLKSPVLLTPSSPLTVHGHDAEGAFSQVVSVK